MADDSFECIVEIPKGSRNKYEFEGIDDKILAVPLTDPGWNTLTSLDEVPDQLQNEIAHFFTVCKQLENKKVEVEGWFSREDAIEEIEASRERFREGDGKHH